METCCSAKCILVSWVRELEEIILDYRKSFFLEIKVVLENSNPWITLEEANKMVWG